MQIIPVLDLKGGQAVHAVRGERARYAPVRGMLGDGEDPVGLAAAYRDRLGCRACYVADLDAIAGAPISAGLLRELAGLGLALWVDAGVSSADQARALLDLGVTKVIIGSETLRALDQLAELAAGCAPDRLVFSVDLHGGALRAPPGADTPQALVAHAALAGMRDLILLDLAHVGANSGPPLALLAALRERFPGLAFYTGGGVRGRADLDALARAGATGALIATALHRGALTAADLAEYR